MKKILTIISAVALLWSCSSTTVNDDTTKREQLQQYKQEIHDLTQKIELLENELNVKTSEEIVNVKVKELAPTHFEHFIEVTGKVEADLDVDVSPESSGEIESIQVKEGQWVSKGQTLARLKSDALERTLDEMKIQQDLAVINFQRQKNLWDQNIGSEMQYLQAKTNKESLEKRIAGLEAQLDMAVVKSPVSGIVDIIYQKKGQIGSPQFRFAKVVNIEKIKIYADVSETYLTKIKKGDKVTVSFPALNRETKATIRQIGNIIDPNNRTFRVRIDMNNPDKMIKPNLVSIIKIRDYVAENAIVIPTLYIREDFKGHYTYVVSKKGDKNIAHKVYVTQGVTDNNLTEITKGLSAGLKVVSEGYNQIVDGTIIRF